MLWSQLHIPTQRQDPTDAPSRAVAWLVRAGYVRLAASGVYELLPLARRLLDRWESVVRQEVETSGLATASLRLSEADVADFERRTGVVTLARQHQIEWTVPAAGERLGPLVTRIFDRLGIPVTRADADVDRPPSVHTFVLSCDLGREAVLTTPDGRSYTPDACPTAARPWSWGGDPFGEYEKVHTPGVTTVADVAQFLGVPTSRVLKTLVFRTDATRPTLESGVNARWAVAVVRGDHDVSFAKLRAAAREHFHVDLRPLETTPEIADQFAVGFCGPEVAMRKLDAVLLVDCDAANSADWVAGANVADHHALHWHWFRECGDRLADPKKTAVADLRSALAGDPAPGGGSCAALRAVTVARVFHVGAGSARAELSFERLLFTLAQTSCDEHGLHWPADFAPFDAVVTPVKYDGPVREATDRLHADMTAAGLHVLVDDRDVRPGVKFAEADLIGVPVRITLGERTLASQSAELKPRGREARIVPLAEVPRQILGRA